MLYFAAAATAQGRRHLSAATVVKRRHGTRDVTTQDAEKPSRRPVAATVLITRLYHCDELQTVRSSSLLTTGKSTTSTELDPWHLHRARFLDFRAISFVHWRQLYCQLRLDEPTSPPILLIVCEMEPEDVDDHERQHRQPRDGQIQLTVLQSRVQL